MASAAPLLDVEGLEVRYAEGRSVWGRKATHFVAVDNVSFALRKGQTLGLVGESGSGKSTIAKALLRLVPMEKGIVRFEGQELQGLSESAFRPYRRKIQTVFQDPYASLDPRQTVESIVAEPLLTHEPQTTRLEARDRVAEMLEKVGLSADVMRRYPHQFSGGQRQRISIARALSCRPECIICDECVSALDVSVQAQIVNLLRDLQEEFGVSYLFIAHDLAIVEHMSHDVIVLKEGRIVEQGPARSIYRNPQHIYTQTLLEAVPKMPSLQSA